MSEIECLGEGGKSQKDEKVIEEALVKFRDGFYEADDSNVFWITAELTKSNITEVVFLCHPSRKSVFNENNYVLYFPEINNLKLFQEFAKAVEEFLKENNKFLKRNSLAERKYLSNSAYWMPEY